MVREEATLNRAHEKGRLAEYYVKRLLERQGYAHIIRSFASLTPIDLIASNGDDVLAVQVKVRGYISTEGKELLLQWASKFHARACFARKHKGRWVIRPIESSPEARPSPSPVPRMPENQSAEPSSK